MGRRRRDRVGLSAYQRTKLNRAFDRADREDALRKEHSRCHYCRAKLTINTVTRDHVEPRSLGGSNKRQNIVAACERCNRAKGSIPYKRFMQLIRFPASGDPLFYRFIWMDWRINRALQNLERNVAKAVGLTIIE